MPAGDSEGFHHFGVILNTHAPLEEIDIDIHTDGDSTTVLKGFRITECVKGKRIHSWAIPKLVYVGHCIFSCFDYVPLHLKKKKFRNIK